MTQKQTLGILGENLACEYLIKKGYKIIGRNFRKPWGELDIISRTPDKTLVFVEVKTVSEGEISAENQLTKSKLEKLKRTTSLYAGHYPELVDDEKGWRIDLLAIKIKNDNYFIDQYENIDK